MADAVEKPRRKPHSKGFIAANLVVVAGFLGVLVLFAMLVSRGTSNGWSSLQAEGRRRLLEGAEHGRPRGAGVQVQRRADRGRPGATARSTRTPSWTGSRSRGSRSARSGAPSSSSSRPARRSPTSSAAARRAAVCRARVRRTRFRCSAARRSSSRSTPSSTRRASNRSSACCRPLGNANYAIYLRRRNFEKELSKPLDATLPRHKVLSYPQLSPVEKATVDRLTMKNTYQSQFSQGANGRTLLVLRSVGQ